MATLEDIEITPFPEMSKDEAIEYLRQLRLQRRVPDQKKSTSTNRKIAQTKSAKISKHDAETLLKLLTQ